MGNRVGTNDGFNFRGRGGSQVTGRDGYQKLGDKVGLPLIEQFDLVNAPQHFLECAVADFIICGCLPFAAHDDVSGVTFHLNGGFIGLPERTAWLVRWKRVLEADNPPPHSTTWLQQSLNRLGTEPPLITDGSFGPVTAAAVKAFQQMHGIASDGRAIRRRWPPSTRRSPRPSRRRPALGQARTFPYALAPWVAEKA